MSLISKKVKTFQRNLNVSKKSTISSKSKFSYRLQLCRRTIKCLHDYDSIILWIQKFWY